MNSLSVRCDVVTSLIYLAMLIAAPAHGAAPDATESTPAIPQLAWEQRSDWINVKTTGAKGDGIADDTAAIQASLDRLAEGVTIYFPPGTYRITQTLQCPHGRFPGVTLIGHGRTTILAWDGEVGGRMFWTNEGMLYTRFVGLTWDGRGKAAVGFDHASQKIYETEMRHQYEAYLNFTEAGIRVGHQMKTATAETLYDNCLFSNCGHGVSLHSFNVLDHAFDGCEFYHCGVGLFGAKGTNFYIRNSHFEQSAEADITCGGEQGSSVRRCTSHGSNRFLSFTSSVGPLVIQDCKVDAWRDTASAISLAGAPVLIFDCTFTHPPSVDQSPIRVNRAGQRLIVSNNRAEGSPSVVRMPQGAKLVEIPAGARSGVVKSAAQTFLKSSVRIAGKVFDAKRDFGAKGDGIADDTASINNAIAAARAHGNGAIAYLPPGRYVVSDTLVLTGSDYYFGGSGYRSALMWKGKPGGTTVEIRDPDRITLENIVVGHHDSGAVGANAIDILQTSSGKPSSVRYDRVWVWGMYQNKPLERGLRLVGLGKHDRVYFHEVNGNLHFTDSAAATVYLGLSYEGTLLAQGKSPARDGFLGGSVRLGTVTDPALWVMDNQSIVMSDFYVESSLHVIRLSGDGMLPPGRVTLQGAKFEISKPENNGTEIENYRGELVLGPYQFYVGNPLHHFVQHGEAPFALTLLGGLFYNSKPEFRLSPSTKLAVVGCDSVVLNKADAIDGVPGVADTSMPDAQPGIIRALDDLRRLGDVDLEMSQSWQ
ncbi:MAG TPA: glycosyl hydrolase family 28-related protein [Humisphaera sp.]|nr:glycosyl hydrolase family 28-related protein [Humisphaera sp.]